MPNRASGWSRNRWRAAAAVAGLVLLCPAPDAESAATGANPATFVFDCDSGARYVVRTTDEQAWIFRPGGSLRLEPAPSRRNDFATDGNLLRIDGQSAWISIAGDRWQVCVNDPGAAVWEHAKLNGVDFRAIGNEPGWVLEIVAGERLELNARYGAIDIERPLPEPEPDIDAGRTLFDAGDLVVELAPGPCVDTMSGVSLETVVTVHWRGETLRGCGRALH